MGLRSTSCNQTQLLRISLTEAMIHKLETRNSPNFPPLFFFYGLCSPEFIGGNLAPLTSARLPRTDDSKTQSDRENRHPQILTQVSATRDSNPVKTAFRQPPSSLRVLLAYRRAWPSDNMSQTWLGYFVQCVM